jgi:hypothetical protein
MVAPVQNSNESHFGVRMWQAEDILTSQGIEVLVKSPAPDPGRS